MRKQLKNALWAQQNQMSDEIKQIQKKQVDPSLDHSREDEEDEDISAQIYNNGRQNTVDLGNLGEQSFRGKDSKHLLKES